MTFVQGPAWTAPGLDVAAGRYPLSVERHVMRMADLLVPGITTVTPHARYYALHALIAVEAADRKLNAVDTQDLLRRAEVALAAASYAHDHGDTGLPRAHGLDALAGRLRSGEVDVEEASHPGRGGYVRNAWGFWNPYAASEITLQILSPGDLPTPGEACDWAAVREGLAGLLELARQSRLVVGDLHGHGDLCVCAGGGAADGRWLARLLYAHDADDGSRARTRWETIRLLTRVMQTHEIRDVTRDAGPVMAFGDFVTTDPVTADLAVMPVWRGVLLRNYAVGAWRRLWSWLVAQVEGLMPVGELVDLFADRVPAGTVAAFVDEVPATTTPTGTPAPAEQHLRAGDLDLPVCELAVLAANSRRVDELTGRIRDAFLGQRGVELGPEWMARRLAEARPMSLRDFVRELTTHLLNRGQRVALSKARRRADGTLWVPTRLHQRGELLYRTSQEGRGDVGVRLDQLTTVLASAGVLRRVGRTWQVATTGEALLG